MLDRQQNVRCFTFKITLTVSLWSQGLQHKQQQNIFSTHYGSVYSVRNMCSLLTRLVTEREIALRLWILHSLRPLCYHISSRFTVKRGKINLLIMFVQDRAVQMTHIRRAYMNVFHIQYCSRLRMTPHAIAVYELSTFILNNKLILRSTKQPQGKQCFHLQKKELKIYSWSTICIIQPK